MTDLKELFPKLPIAISATNPQQARWIQAQLKTGGYLKDAVDGIPGRKTQEAFAKFKSDLYLDSPDTLGKSSLEALAQLGDRHPINADQGTQPILAPNANAGNRSGRSHTLPVVGLVFANEWILPGVPLTWGEVTKDLTRIPTAAGEVNNILELAKVFGQVRSRYGKPLAITSGFRPAAVNRAIGGASNSQHIYGKALDIVPSDGNFAVLLDILKATPAVGGIGLGQRKGFLHMDTRSSRVIWRY